MATVVPVVGERRASPRIRERLPVLVTDSEDALEHPYAGWLVNRSQGGVCLFFRRTAIAVGALLLIRFRTANRVPAVLVRVCNRRGREDAVELGCQFAPTAIASASGFAAALRAAADSGR
jgi:hypothetical protein